MICRRTCKYIHRKILGFCRGRRFLHRNNNNYRRLRYDTILAAVIMLNPYKRNIFYQILLHLYHAESVLNPGGSKKEKES